MNAHTPVTPAPSLAATQVTKQFGDLRALDRVDLEIRSGRVHALLGENGAGKSTITKILAGMQQPSAGQLTRDGAPLVLTSREQALRHGIGLLPQQLSLNREMNLVENFVLTRDDRVVRRREAERVLRDTIARAGFRIDPLRQLQSLSLAERQFAELTIALACGAEVLLLDEPTSALGPFETEGLFRAVRSLADAGTAVLLITHRIDEVRRVADDVTVLRGGVVHLAGHVRDFDDAQLVHALVGHAPEAPSAAPRLFGDKALQLRHVTHHSAHGRELHDVSIDVRSGEIVGVLGVAGNGQSALASVAAALDTPARGQVLIDGIDVTGRPQQALAAGLRIVSEDRSENLLPDRPLYVSASVLKIALLAQFARIPWHSLTAHAQTLIAKHDVRPATPNQTMGDFSGGNQQKLLVGRELDGEPRAIVLHGPTQGLDIHAAAAIRSHIAQAAQQGAAVLLISSDVDEVVEIADRVVVLAGGQVSDEFEIADFEQQRLGRAMSGLAAASPVLSEASAVPSNGALR